MPHFEVRFLDRARVSTRQVEAADAQAACSGLGVGSAQVLSVREAAQSAGKPGPLAGVGSGAFPLRLFSQELAVLLGAGVPLLEALITLREKEGSARVRSALSTLIEQLQVGASFSQALAMRPRDFAPLFAAVVGAAERSGQLREALEAHARYLAWVEELRARLVAAAIYPLMLVAVSVAVLIFLLVFVVPRFAALLDGMGGELPTGSRLLLQLGAAAGAHPALAVMLGLSLFVLPVLVLRRPSARLAAARALAALPGLGARLRLLALARLYRTVGMLLDAGVAVVPALRVARGVTPVQLQPALDAAIERVTRGERLSAAFDEEGLSTPVSARMLRVGERSGEVGPMLNRAAAFYDEELARLSDWVTRLINPLLMLLMGALIGTVVVLLYLPIFQLAETVQ